MRALFLILILANLAFFAYAHWLRGPNPAVMDLPKLEVQPQKIRIIRVGERASAPAHVAAAAPATVAAPTTAVPEASAAAAPATSDAPAVAAGAEATKVAAAAPLPAGSAPARTVQACLRWGLLEGTDIARADAAIAKLGLPQSTVQRTISEATGYWVYMAPAKTPAAVGRRVALLKSHGVHDFYVVRDSSRWRNAISLGIFKSEEAARTRAAMLRKQGILGVTVGPRNDFLKEAAYYLHEPSDAIVARITRLQEEFPGSEVNAVACPATGAAAP